MDVDQIQNLIFTGSGDGELKAWRIDPVSLSEGVKETEDGEVSSQHPALDKPLLSILKVNKFIHPVALLPLSSHHRVSQVLFHPTEPYLAVQSHERSVEIFRIRTGEELRKKAARRKKRMKEKKTKEKDKGNTEDMDVDNSDAEADEEVQLTDIFTPYLVVRSSAKIRSFNFGSEHVGPKDGTQVCCFGMRLEHLALNCLKAVHGLDLQCDGGLQYSQTRQVSRKSSRSRPHIFS
jgi:U3 small nucleolar RNA-associated protein 12